MFTHSFFVRMAYSFAAAVLALLVLAPSQALAQVSETMTLQGNNPCPWIDPSLERFVLSDLSGVNGNGEFVAISTTSDGVVPVRIILFRQDGACKTWKETVGTVPVRYPVHADEFMQGQEGWAVVQPLVWGDWHKLSVEHSRYWGNMRAGTNASATWTAASHHLAEGVFNSFFTEEISVVTTSNQPVWVEFLFYDEQGGRYRRTAQIPTSPGRLKVKVNELLAGYALSHSTAITGYHVEDNSYADIAVEREIRWNGEGSKAVEGHAESGKFPYYYSYFAEGHKSQKHATFFLIGNFDINDADVHMMFMHENGHAYFQDVHVPYFSRKTVAPPDYMPNGSFATMAWTDDYRFFLVERAMYWGEGVEGGHVSAGSNSLSNRWFFAEGTTGGTYRQYLLLANFSGMTTDVSLKIKDSEGTLRHHSLTIPWGRTTVDIEYEIPDLAGKDFSIEVQANNLIVAERALYGGLRPDGTWTWGHSSMGKTVVNPWSILSEIRLY
jgi:hypothetical protein